MPVCPAFAVAAPAYAKPALRRAWVGRTGRGRQGDVFSGEHLRKWKVRGTEVRAINKR
jgi:hypothetical protein